MVELKIACVQAAKEITLAMLGTDKLKSDNAEYNQQFQEMINKAFVENYSTIISAIRKNN